MPRWLCLPWHTSLGHWIGITSYVMAAVCKQHSRESRSHRWFYFRLHGDLLRTYSYYTIWSIWPGNGGLCPRDVVDDRGADLKWGCEWCLDGMRKYCAGFNVSDQLRLLYTELREESKVLVDCVSNRSSHDVSPGLVCLRRPLPRRRWLHRVLMLWTSAPWTYTTQLRRRCTSHSSRWKPWKLHLFLWRCRGVDGATRQEEASRWRPSLLLAHSLLVTRSY